MILDCTFVSVAMNQVRRNNRYTDAMLKSLDVALNTEKCFGVFARSSTRQSGDREHACARARPCACVYVYIFLFLVSSPLSASVTAIERDRDALFPPPSRSFHLFRSRHCMPRGDELSLSTFSIYLPPTASLFLPACLSVTLGSSWQIRAVDESTRRYLDISANTRLMRDADVFIHRRTFPILTNDAPYRTLLV